MFDVMETILTTFIPLITLCIVVKMLTQNYKWSKKEFIFFGCYILVSGALVLVTEVFSESHIYLFFANFLSMLVIALYYYKVVGYSPKQSFILPIVALAILSLIDVFLAMVSNYVLRTPQLWLMISATVLSIPVTFLFVKASSRLRARIKRNERILSILFYTSLCINVFILVYDTIVQSDGNIEMVSFVFEILLFVASLAVGFYLFHTANKQKYLRQQIENEQKQLLFYTEQIEAQQANIRKFRHDYQNMLTSFRYLLDEGDLEALRKYYAQLELASEIVDTKGFALEGLSNVKVGEVKGILWHKLSEAQNLGIAVTLQSADEIKEIPVDSVSLVRMLGIVLDNAIEALAQIIDGQLVVGIAKLDSTIVITVENTFHAEDVTIRQFNKRGFSTKGQGRGIGLSNLAELVKASPNVTLSTSMEDGKFSQTFVIDCKH